MYACFSKSPRSQFAISKQWADDFRDLGGLRKLEGKLFDIEGVRFVYILRSLGAPEQLYVGSAVNVEGRLKIHNRGECPHTSKYMPWKVVYVELFESEELAVRRERQIKKWRGKKKEALIRGDVEELKRLSKRRLL